MNDREILQHATSFFREQYPTLNAEAFVAFIVIADHDAPTVGDVSVAIGKPDVQVFQYMAPLRNAGLVNIQPQAGGNNAIFLTNRGEEARQAITDMFAG